MSISEMLVKSNIKAFELISKYNNLEVDGHVFKTPYYVNDVENFYKDAMLPIAKQLFSLSVALNIRTGKTPIGSSAGKGLPEEIQESMQRCIRSLVKREIIDGVNTTDHRIVYLYFLMYQIGLDCSGFVYNILEQSLPEEVWEKCKRYLGDKGKVSRSRMSVKRFYSTALSSSNFDQSLQEFDLVFTPSNTHMGIILKQGNNIVLADCSQYKEGISINKIDFSANFPTVVGREFWTTLAKENKIEVKRLNFS